MIKFYITQLLWKKSNNLKSLKKSIYKKNIYWFIA